MERMAAGSSGSTTTTSSTPKRWDALRDFKPKDRSSRRNHNINAIQRYDSRNRYRACNSVKNASKGAHHQGSLDPIAEKGHLSSGVIDQKELNISPDYSLLPLTNELINAHSAENLLSVNGLLPTPSNEELLWKELEFAPIGSLSEHSIENLIHVTSLWGKKKTWSLEQAMFAERILFRMEEEEKHRQYGMVNNGTHGTVTTTKSRGDLSIAPEFMHYVNVIHAYACTQGSTINGHRAEYIINRLDQRVKQEQRTDLKPNRFAINTAIGAYCKSSHPFAAESAERLLTRLEVEYEQRRDNDLKPSSRSYSKVTDAFARRGDADGAYKVLLRMMTEFEKGNDKVGPSKIVYTNVMDAFAKSKIENAAEKAENVLHFLLRQCDANEQRKQMIDCTVFCVAIDAWAKSNKNDKGRRAMDILDLMKSYVQPDIQTYNVVLNALAEDDRDIHLAEDLLDQIEKSRVLEADSFTYNALLKAYFKQSVRQGVWGAKKAQDLLQHWEDEYAHGKTRAKPDSHSYFALIKSWALSDVSEAAKRANDVLEYMEEGNIEPSRFCYNAVIQAWSRSYDNRASQSAELVFQNLLKRHRQTHSKELKPDKFSYIGLIAAYTRSADTGPPYRAEELLREMCNDRNLENPDKKSYHRVIASWARSAASLKGNVDAGLRAEALIDLMLSSGTKPDTMNMNAVITAYVNSTHRKSDPNRAIDVLHRMHDIGVDPSSVTYTILLKVSYLYGDEMLEEIVNDCIDRGMLDNKILAKVISMGRPKIVCNEISKQYKGREGAEGGGIGLLPQTWSRNANRGPASQSRNQHLRKCKRQC